MRDLDWALIKVARWLFLGHFWPLLTWATIFGDALSLPKIGSSLKPNNRCQISLSESQIHTVPYKNAYSYYRLVITEINVSFKMESGFVCSTMTARRWSCGWTLSAPTTTGRRRTPTSLYPSVKAQSRQSPITTKHSAKPCKELNWSFQGCKSNTSVRELLNNLFQFVL